MRLVHLFQNVTCVARALCFRLVGRDRGASLFGQCSNSLLPEGGVVLGWQEGLYRFRPGAADMRVVGNLTGNAQQPGVVWETGVKQLIVRRERE